MTAVSPETEPEAPEAEAVALQIADTPYRYRYLGDHPLVLSGLAVGTNARVVRDGAEHPVGTVVAEPGDLIETSVHYPHALLLQIAAPEPEAAAGDDEPAEAAPQTPARKRKTPTTDTESQE